MSINKNLEKYLTLNGRYFRVKGILHKIEVTDSTIVYPYFAHKVNAFIHVDDGSLYSISDLSCPETLAKYSNKLDKMLSTYVETRKGLTYDS